MTRTVESCPTVDDVPDIVKDWYETHPNWGPLDYQDNVERILCPREGKDGHDSCGYCHTCGAPNFCGCGCPDSRGGFNEGLKAQGRTR